MKVYNNLVYFLLQYWHWLGQHFLSYFGLFQREIRIKELLNKVYPVVLTRHKAYLNHILLVECRSINAVASASGALSDWLLVLGSEIKLGVIVETRLF